MILGIMAGLLALTVLVVLLRSLWIRSGLNTRQTVMTIGVAVLIIAVVALTVTGRLNWIATALAAVIGLARWIGGGARLALWLRTLRGGAPNATASGSRSNGSSDNGTTSTESPFFRMTLHHASGHMDGEIKQGRHKSRFLSELSFAELVELIGEVQDFDSRHLLESYLDHHYPNWRSGPDRTRDPSKSTMDRREALEALGLEDGASRDDIVAAHRRLIQRLHPDRGGSTYLAALLNRAKEILLDGH
jgi:hypothetical protein